MSAVFELDWLQRRPYRDLHPRFLQGVQRFTHWPAPENYDELVSQVPSALYEQLPRFVRESRSALTEHGGYEQHVAKLRAVPTRPEHWHDFFNMSVWAHFPKLRWALNSLHVDPDVGPKDPRNGRAPAQNLAATLDEAGMLVLSTDPSILTSLRALHFRNVFWERRAELLATTRFWVVGHGLLEALLTPRPGLSARSLLLHVPSLPPANAQTAIDLLRFETDAAVAARVESWRSRREVLDPVPVLAIPGFSDNDSTEFYDDMRNIRYVPVSRRPRSDEGACG